MFLKFSAGHSACIKTLHYKLQTNVNFASARTSCTRGPLNCCPFSTTVAVSSLVTRLHGVSWATNEWFAIDVPSPGKFYDAIRQTSTRYHGYRGIRPFTLLRDITLAPRRRLRGASGQREGILLVRNPKQRFSKVSITNSSPLKTIIPHSWGFSLFGALCSRSFYKLSRIYCQRCRTVTTEARLSATGRLDSWNIFF